MVEARDPHEREPMRPLPPLEQASRDRAKERIAELRRVLAGELPETESHDIPADPAEEPF